MNYWKISETEKTNYYIVFNTESFWLTELNKNTEIEKAIELKELKNVTSFRYNELKEIILIDTDHLIEFNFKDDDIDEVEIEFDANAFKEIKTLLSNNFEGVDVKNYSVLKQTYPGLIGAVISGIATFVVYNIATSLENGESVRVSGRRSFIKQVFVWIAEFLGTTGSLIVGGVFIFIFLFLIYKTITKPKKGIVLKINGIPQLNKS